MASTHSQTRRGYAALYIEQVTQADEGCDFKFLQGAPGETAEPDIFKKNQTLSCGRKRSQSTIIDEKLMTSIRVGIAGTSWWADDVLACSERKSCAEVVAFCGRNPQRTKDFAQRWGILNYYTDYQIMLNEAELDAVIISTGNDTHAPFTWQPGKRDSCFVRNHSDSTMRKL